LIKVLLLGWALSRETTSLFSHCLIEQLLKKVKDFSFTRKVGICSENRVSAEIDSHLHFLRFDIDDKTPL
jgi:hypothetical protein